MMGSVPEGDVGSLGQLNEEYFRARIRGGAAIRRNRGATPRFLRRSAGEGRMADDVVRLTAGAGGERHVDPGRYLVDYKAGERAFDLDQARRYAETLAEQSNVTAVLYISTGRGEAEVAAAAARRARGAALQAQQQIMSTVDIPVRRRSQFLFAFLNETGELTWL